jgi:putative hydrolase of the HAD superfamily
VTPVRAVICDFGGVLTGPLLNGFVGYQHRTGITLEDLGRALQASAERTGAHPLFVLERGEISEEEFLRRVERELPGGARLEGFRETYFEHLEPNEPMIGYMRELRDRGLRMALLTNNVREWETLWRAKIPDLDEVFELVVDSAFVGMRKPEPGIYELTLDRLGDVTAEECVFVDDLEPNCVAARELGMRTVRFEATEQAVAEIELALR